MRIARTILATVGVFTLTCLVLSTWHSWQEAGHQAWGRPGYEWLVLDFWSRQFPLKQAVVAALVGLAFFAGLEFMGRGRACDVARKFIGAFGHPVTTVLLMATAFGVPSLVAGIGQPMPPKKSPNVLFLLVDTWRADHAGFLGYERPEARISPNLDRLVQSGVVFENAIAPAGWTKPSVATLFTGLMPARHRAISQPVAGLPVRGTALPPGVTTFVEIFRANGWDTGMWSNNPNILPVRGFDQGARHFVDYFHHVDRRPDHDPGRAEHMLPDVEHWLAEGRDPARPFCAYVHVMDPHYPYVAPPPFKGMFDKSGLDLQLSGPVVDDYMRGKRDLDEVTDDMLQRIVDIYDEELLYVDHYLGPFLERVRKEHPNTVIILSGDHGEEFKEHGQFGHGHSLYQELTHVPLVIWAPGLKSQRIKSQVRLMDVFPTLLELSGVGAFMPEGVQGSSLIPMMRGSETGPRLAPMESGGDERPAWHWRALSNGRYKMIRREEDLPTQRDIARLSDRDDEDRPTYRLYDLLLDPDEQEDLFEKDPERAHDLFELMQQGGWYVSPEEILSLRPINSDELSSSDVNLLKALGYAE